MRQRARVMSPVELHRTAIGRQQAGDDANGWSYRSPTVGRRRTRQRRRRDRRRPAQSRRRTTSAPAISKGSEGTRTGLPIAMSRSQLHPVGTVGPPRYASRRPWIVTRSACPARKVSLLVGRGEKVTAETWPGPRADHLVDEAGASQLQPRPSPGRRRTAWRRCQRFLRDGDIDQARRSLLRSSATCEIALGIMKPSPCSSGCKPAASAYRRSAGWKRWSLAPEAGVSISFCASAIGFTGGGCCSHEQVGEAFPVFCSDGRMMRPCPPWGVDVGPRGAPVRQRLRIGRRCRARAAGSCTTCRPIWTVPGFSMARFGTLAAVQLEQGLPATAGMSPDRPS